MPSRTYRHGAFQSNLPCQRCRDRKRYIIELQRRIQTARRSTGTNTGALRYRRLIAELAAEQSLLHSCTC